MDSRYAPAHNGTRLSKFFRKVFFQTMGAKIIGLVQVKGGAGRSTVATNLAGMLSLISRVALIDTDMPQGTSASWAALRQQIKPSDRFTAYTASTHAELVAKVEEIRGSVDHIILDAPPRIAEITRAILVLSDLCLVPVGASAAEVWATSDLLAMIEEARKIRAVNARLLWTRFRAYTRLAQDLAQEAEKALSLPAMKSTIGYRVAYAEALGAGLTASELHDANAKQELVNLVLEIKKLLR